MYWSTDSDMFHFKILAMAMLFGTLLFPRSAVAELVELSLQTRDPQNGVVITTPTKIDPAKLGVVVVDIWNWHWCKTAAARVDAFVPRMNVCLDELRGMGATVFLCPTDVVDAYVGTPQRERALAVKSLPLPEPMTFSCPEPPQGPGCACIVRCRGNFGWNAMNPRLTIGADDLMPNSRESLYTLAKRRDITHLLYMGVHTQVCLLGKDIGLRNMKMLGFECILARDLTDSHPDYDPARGIDPDELTARTVAHFERYLCSTVNLQEQLERLGHWPVQQPLDPVGRAIGGRTDTPISSKKRRSSRSALRYSRAPKSTTRPTAARRRCKLISIANRYGCHRRRRFELRPSVISSPVCVESTFQYYKLSPMPPVADVHLAELKPVQVVGPGHSPSDRDHRFSPVSRPPQMNRSNRGQPLCIGGQVYEHGIGAHAPNRMLYSLDPTWERFVALVGVDENIVDTNHGSDLGCIPSVVFRVFMDGQLAAESPVMRFMQPAWRFDILIPEGAEQIALVAHPTEDGNREDLADWVNAGFVVRAGK